VPTRARTTIEEQEYTGEHGRVFLRSVRVHADEWPVPPTNPEGWGKGALLPLSLTRTDRGWRVKAPAIPILWLESLYGSKGQKLGVELWNAAVEED
jgi:hypothetical protein